MEFYEQQCLRMEGTSWQEFKEKPIEAEEGLLEKKLIRGDHQTKKSSERRERLTNDTIRPRPPHFGSIRVQY